MLNELAGKVKPDTSYLQEVLHARNACRDALRATLGVYNEFCVDLRNSLDQDTILVTDVTISATLWGSRLFPVYGPHQYIHAAGGGIGQGLQMGLGAKLGQPKRQSEIYRIEC
jgi:acetolactate synthase I/II/III large subunit